MRYATLCFCIGIATLADPPAFARTDTGTQQRPKRPDQPRATLAASWSAPAALSGASGDMQAWYASVNTSFKPHPFKSGLLSPGLDYRHARYRFDGAAPPLADRSLHAIQLPLDYRTARADSRWGWWARIAPELATDFEHVDEHDLNLTLIGSARYAAGERLQLLLGVFASTHFGDVIAFPAPGLIWQPRPEWLVRLTPPRAALVRRLGPATSLTLATWLEGGSWNIDDDGRPVDFSHRAIRAGLGLTAPIGSRFDLTLWAGANLLQEIELQDEDGDTLFESDVHESPFVSCALRVLDW